MSHSSHVPSLLKYVLFPAFLCLYIPHVFAQSNGPAIVAGPNVRVSTDRPDRYHGETAWAAHPSNPQLLIGGSMIYDPSRTEDHSVVYVSTDGGATWHATLETGAGQSVDPSYAMSRTGGAYFLHDSDGNGYCEFYRSNDGGLTWSAPIRLNLLDRSWLAVDNTGGRYDGRIYIVGAVQDANKTQAVVLYYSSDGGITFTGPVGATGLGGDPSNPVVLSDGTVVLNSILSGESGRLLATRSTDGGAHLSPAIEVAHWTNTLSLGGSQITAIQPSCPCWRLIPRVAPVAIASMQCGPTVVREGPKSTSRRPPIGDSPGAQR
ncbi:MAG TPA: sialidase family protein [Bryobacteraceae bacterium]|jgi:hypothetical protein|nr:sialidase family protein [Bryobacteraceae bacterium]